MTTRVTPNGTTVVEDGPFLLHGFRVGLTRRTGGPGPGAETLRITTLDGRRTVGLWTRWPSHSTGLVCHYRDRGDDALQGVELDELLAHARDGWPNR